MDDSGTDPWKNKKIKSISKDIQINFDLQVRLGLFSCYISHFMPEGASDLLSDRKMPIFFGFKNKRRSAATVLNRLLGGCLDLVLI